MTCSHPVLSLTYMPCHDIMVIPFPPLFYFLVTHQHESLSAVWARASSLKHVEYLPLQANSLTVLCALIEPITFHIFLHWAASTSMWNYWPQSLIFRLPCAQVQKKSYIKCFDCEGLFMPVTTFVAFVGLLAPGSIMEDLKLHNWGLNEGLSARPVMVVWHTWHHLLLLKIAWDGAETIPG